MIDTPPSDPVPNQPIQAAASMHIVGQYIKDFSFENPNAPNLRPDHSNQPKIQIDLNVQAINAPDGRHEVTLRLEILGKQNDDVMFATELVYAGLFEVKVDSDQIRHRLLYVEGARFLFPFARQILASTIQAAGFPPLLLDPIDFEKNYTNALQQQNPATLAN